MDKIKLSPYHKIFYNEWRLDPGSFKYNIVFDQTLSSTLDIIKLKAVIKRFISDYLLLNSHILEEDQELYWVKNDVINELEFFSADYYNLQKIYDYVTRSFNLEQSPLYRFAIFENNKSEYRFIIVIHHILIDGNSFDELINQISNYYNDDLYTMHINLNEQASIINAAVKKLEDSLKLNTYHYQQFWENTLSNIEPLDLRFLAINAYSTNTKSENKKVGAIQEIKFSFAEYIFDKLGSTGYHNKITLYTYSQCVFAILLYRYTRQEKLAISYPSVIKDGYRLIGGSIINTNFIPYEFNQNITIKDLFNQVKIFNKSLKENNIEHSHYPVYKILENTNKGLLNIAFAKTNLKNTSFNFKDVETLKINKEFNVDIINKLAFELENKNKQLDFRIKYNKLEIDKQILKQFVYHYKKLFCDILDDLIAGNTNKQINSYQILDDLEYHKIIYKWNNTFKEYPNEKTIHQLFEEQVLKTPNNIAVVYDDKTITYVELNKQANQLAHYISSKYKIVPDELIALYLDRSEYMLISILAVLKSGAAYVPIDTNQPLARVKYILKDTQARVVLVNARYYDYIVNFNMQNALVLSVDSLNLYFSLIKQPVNNILTNTNCNNLAYIMYTSGTTGQPNGVMVEHKNVVSLVKNIKHLHINDSDRFILLASIAFDASTFEIWTPLLNGCSLFIPFDKLEILSKVKEFGNYLYNNKITVLWLTKMLFDQLYNMDETIFSYLHYLFIGGEALDKAKINRLCCSKYKPLRLINGYGPTENTTFSTYYDILSNVNYYSNIPIGRPLNNRRCYILDNYLQPLPIGAIGELYVGGDGITRGYHNKPKLTQERFIQNPFHYDLQNNKKDLLYKTGDLVRYLPDGNLEYIGRNDLQVKVRGYRVELGEIESVLCKYQGVKQAVVIAVNYKTDYLNEDVLPAELENINGYDSNKPLLMNVPDNLTIKPGLLPIQEWFFTQKFKKINHWNQSFLIKTPKLNRQLLKKSLQILINSHASFKLRYKKSSNSNLSSQYSQYEVSDNQNDPIILKELDINMLYTTESSTNFNIHLQQILTSWQSNFDIEHGPLSSFGYIYGYQDGSTRVFFALHHLIVDVVSWHILVHDLHKIYTNLCRVDKNDSRYNLERLERKSTSYLSWIKAINVYAKHHNYEKKYWLEVLSEYKEFERQLNALTKDNKKNSKLDYIQTTEVTFMLNLEDSATIINGNKFENKTNLVLLAPVVVAVKQLLEKSSSKDIDNSDTVYITLEGHGRENIAQNINISDTVGWFTTMFPVKLVANDDLSTVLKSTQASLYNVPNKGIGYGALFGYDDLPKISFNYLGQLSKFAADWSITDEQSGNNIDAKNLSSNIIDVLCYIINGKVVFKITSQLDKGMLDQFASIIKTKLIELIKLTNQTYENKKAISNKYLAAYYVSDSELDEVYIREFLSEQLPIYSIPQIFTKLDAIPLTLNGKVDVNALPKPKHVNNNKYYPPSNEKEQLICNAYAQILNKIQISIDDDFFTYGGDSILAISLVRILQHHFSVTIRDIYNYRTPAKLAQNIAFSNNYIKNKLLAIIDLEKKDRAIVKNKTIKDNIQRYMDTINELKPDVTNKLITNVLLTGATGFLGCNILNQLITTTNYNIYILVRATSEQESISRIMYKYHSYFKTILEEVNHRVFIFKADIEKDNLGLSKQQYAALTDKIDSVIHAAALIKQIGEYSAFYAANVTATINLLEFTKLTKLKDFHYISTQSLLKHNENSINQWGNYYCEENLPDNLELQENNVYLRTKLEAERQVVNYRDYGINTNIYRVGNLAFMSGNSVVQDNIQEVGFANWLKYFFDVKCIIENTGIELSPVDLTALGIIKLFDKRCSTNTVYHLFNPYLFDLDSYIQSNKKLAVNIVTKTKFIKHLINEFENTSNRELMVRFLLANGWMEVDGLYQFSKRNYVQYRTQYILSLLNFIWTPINHKQFNQYLKNIL